MSNLNPPLNFKNGTLFSRAIHFQRNRERTAIKKIRRKISLKFRHILLLLLLVAGIFYGIQRICLFLLTWENLSIREVHIISPNAGLKDDVMLMLKGRSLGNILLVDISGLKRLLESHPMVKEVRVRRFFPASLKIEVKDRISIALLFKHEDLYSIDEEGNLLAKVESSSRPGLPLLFDSGNFEENYKDKLNLAWECLESLTLLEREQVEILDLSGYQNVTLQFKNSPTRIILGDDQFRQKLDLFDEYQKTWTNQFGPLDYADLRFSDRVYFRPLQGSNEDVIPNSKEEVQ